MPKKTSPKKEVVEVSDHADEESDDLRDYELMVIVVPNISEADTEKELDVIRKMIKSHKGKIQNEDIWGNRELAYRIKKHETGYYAIFNFVSATSLLPELNKHLTIDTKIVRYLIVKPPRGYVFKTQADFEKEAQLIAEAEGDKEKKEEAKREARKPAAKPEVKKVEATKKPDAAKKTEAPVEKKTAKAKEKTVDLDEKLKSIIDDTDISL